MKKIGFIGLGQMGKWMSLNLIKAGYEVSVSDIDPMAVEFLTEQGANASNTPAEMAASVEWLFMSLPNTEIVESVVLGENGIIHGGKKGLIVVDLSTIGYLPTLEISRRLSEKDICFADAPVSGMEARAKEGDLTVMFGGEEGIFKALDPAFKAIGSKLVYMGAVGGGQLTKLINQLLFNISCAGVAEVLPMAAKLGLDPEKITQVITTGTGRSFAAEFFVPLALDNKFDEGYPLKHAYKDMVSAAEISTKEKIPLPLVQATATTFQEALLEGLGDESKGSLIKVFERKLGISFRKKEGSS